MGRSSHRLKTLRAMLSGILVIGTAAGCPDSAGEGSTDTATGSVVEVSAGDTKADGSSSNDATTDGSSSGDVPQPQDAVTTETTAAETSDASAPSDTPPSGDGGVPGDSATVEDGASNGDSSGDGGGPTADTGDPGDDANTDANDATPGADSSSNTDVSDDVGAASDVPATPTCNAAVTITGPEASTFHVATEGGTFTATVTADVPVETLTVVWTIADGTVVGESTVGADGTTIWVSGSLPVGTIDLTATAHDATGACAGVADTHPARMCQVHIVENFDAALDPSVWEMKGDAYWDSGGWLELTGPVMNRVGQIINTVEYVVEGQAQLTVDLATGGGSSPGADGFAVTILEAESATTVSQIMDSASTGGGLGYGVAGEYGAWDGDALTIEVDTWHNQYNGTTQKHTDPTSDDHLEITLAGDPGNSLAHAELADIEDLNWRTVQVRILNGKVEVRVNGELRIDVQTPQGFSFRGGYIIFSGSTGYYTNFHRVDNLDIIHDCKTSP